MFSRRNLQMANVPSFCNSDLGITNDENSNGNQKKLDMILNFGPTTNSESDQTPTPTRFIRNCEEVGLFQDLQNVNPFDEVFKEAVENQQGVSLQIPVTTADDSLHTPQIYPQLDDHAKSDKGNSTRHSGYLSSPIHTSDEDNLFVRTSKADEDNRSNNKDEKELDEKSTTSKEDGSTAEIQSGSIMPVPIFKLLNRKRSDSILRQREANKAAQTRCRKRKRQQIDDLKAENLGLKQENLKLTALNLYLQESLKKMQHKFNEVKALGVDQSTKVNQHQIEPKSSHLENVPIKKATSTIVSKERSMQSTEHVLVQGTTKIQNHIDTGQKNATTSLLLNPQHIKTNNLVLSVPIQNAGSLFRLPIPSVQPNSKVVLVYPQSPQSIISHTEQLNISGNKMVSNNNRKTSSFKRILPK